MEPKKSTDINILPRPKWYLGFDCATKTFAFNISYIDIDTFIANKKKYYTQYNAIREVLSRVKLLIEDKNVSMALKLINEIIPTISALDNEITSLIRIIDGETIDLFPNRNDNTISTVERIKAVSQYIKLRVVPKLITITEPLRVVIEFQMGPNAKARAISAALVAIFADNDVIIVGPTLKNKVYTCEEGKYCYFAEKYSTSYGANKAHAKYNFANIEKVFGTKIPVTRPESLRGHIADSFMQIIGHIIYGPSEKAPDLYF